MDVYTDTQTQAGMKQKLKCIAPVLPISAFNPKLHSFTAHGTMDKMKSTPH